MRFEATPGRQLQRDWGEIVVELAGVKREIYFAVNTPGFSRRFHVYAAPKCDAEHTCESLVRAFTYFGSVTAEVWEDNQKAAVIELASLIFRLITRRYEKAATVLTSNRSFVGWGEVFSDALTRHRHSRPAPAPRHHPQHQGRELPAQGSARGGGLIGRAPPAAATATGETIAEAS